MGACLSQELGHDDFSVRDAPTAKVISSSGQLREYAIPVAVSVVIQAEAASSSSSPALFLCNSDSLCYEEEIPAMGPDELLSRDQIYFALPMSRLGRPLSASDMAALAVKASLALQNSGRSRRGRKSQISPVLESSNADVAPIKVFDSEGGLEKPPTSPARKLRRSSSTRRLKRAVRSFRVRLSTIQEGPESFHSDQWFSD